MANPNPIDFITNDFLGFCRSDALSNVVVNNYLAYCQKAPHTQSGFGGSRSVLGSSELLESLENKIARYHGCPSAFLAHNGYMANLGFCYHISRETDVLLWDESVHISLVKGLPVISGRHQSFRHNDVNHLESLLSHYRSISSGRIFIFVCSIYSFLGTQAPIAELLILAKKYHAHLIVDEAHAMGIFGDQGKGICSEFGYDNFYAVLVTYSKAMGSIGAAILSSDTVRKELLSTSPPLRYSTALPPYILLTIDAAYNLLPKEGEQARYRLSVLQRHFSNRYPSASLGCVQPITVKGDIQYIAETLRQSQIYVGQINFISSPLLRVNLHAYNTIREIDILMDILEKCSDRIDINHKLYF
ncbi:aminotransferase class I/II-fold pyridoxal phosphate-dependent enzyme [Chlamydia ibidis]|uniref:aminotransferase class I/II-fold pyridoxal phosphate-dependent enzyme n=1 Tax=Chlamydia ibidis TaxID=1405396 RepID=UPI000551DA7C|nr:aminotransferase class I/II-fold pyridoxal phosphate-dependent enzyme [Chlamydia ibidis]